MLLRPAGEPRERIIPFTDPLLSRGKRRHARFVLDLIQANLVKLGDHKAATVGVFFVAEAGKPGPPQQRLIFDTRTVNQEFIEPAHSQLPTAARPGLSEYLTLPRGR